MTPIPPRVMASVSMDLFQMPEVDYDGQKFDAFLLWVDRHSGWMVARPTQYDGLTGEKAAKLMIENSWGEMGIPFTITSDLGPQFISGWWKTMCSRLGIRQAYSQAYRSQTNGRAEVAGRVIQDILRKMHAETGINWVQALPRALRIQHDAVSPITGLSPHQIMFGRHRALAALPWWYEEDIPEATDYFNCMARIDAAVAERLNNAHARIAESINSHRQNPARVPFDIDEFVWHLKPKPLGGVKIGTWWTGPHRVVARTGESSYQILHPGNRIVDVHATELKRCVWEKPENLLVLLTTVPEEVSEDPPGQDAATEIEEVELLE